MLVLGRINVNCVANDRLGIRCKDLLSKHENDWCCSSANYGSKVIDDYVRVTPLGEGTLLNYGKYFSAAMR